MSAYEPAVDVAVVAVAQTQAAAISLTEVEIMLPLINAARDAVGITQPQADDAPRPRRQPPSARHPREQAKRLFPSRDFH